MEDSPMSSNSRRRDKAEEDPNDGTTTAGSPSPTRVSHLRITASEESSNDAISAKLPSRPLNDNASALAGAGRAQQAPSASSSSSFLQKEEGEGGRPTTTTTTSSTGGDHQSQHHSKKLRTGDAATLSPKKQLIRIQILQNALNFMDAFAAQVEDRLTKVSNKIDSLESKVNLLMKEASRKDKDGNGNGNGNGGGSGDDEDEDIGSATKKAKS